MNKLNIGEKCSMRWAEHTTHIRERRNAY